MEMTTVDRVDYGAFLASKRRVVPDAGLVDGLPLPPALCPGCSDGRRCAACGTSSSTPGWCRPWGVRRGSTAMP